MKKNVLTFLIVFSVTLIYSQSSLYLKRPYDASVFSVDAAEVIFSWNHDGSVNYTLEIADDPTFSTPISFNTSNNQYTVAQSNLFSNENYWRVTGSNGTSEVRSFEVIDLNSFGTIAYHIDAESNIVLSSGKVSAWGNKINASYEASQNTGSVRPDYKADEINGHNTVHFGGISGASADYLSLNDFEINDTNFTYFSVSRQETLNSGLSYLLGRGTPLSGVLSGGTAGGGRNFGIVSAPATDVIRVPGTAHLNWSVRTAKFKSLYENDVKFSTIVGDSVTGIQFNTIGVRPDQLTLNFHGDLAEILIFDTSLVEADRSMIDNYLLTKYNPYPDLGNDMDTCTSEVTLGPIDDPAFNSVVWSTGDTDVPTITVTDNGWYWVETEAFDRTVRDSIYIEGMVPKPTLNQVNDTTICLYDTISVGYTNTLPAGISAEWHNGSTGTSVDIFEDDTVYALFSNTSGCTISSDSIITEVNQFPATNGLGSDRTVCLNTELYFEYGNASNGPYTHLWGDGSTNPSFEPTTPGTQEYTIEVTDGMGCTAFDTVEITLTNTDGPLVDFLVDTVCPYSAHQFLDQSSPVSGDPISQYVWRLPDDTLNGSSITYAYSDTTSYIVELEIITNSGCSNVKKDTVTFYPKPSLSFTSTGECEKQLIQFNGGQLTPATITTWEWDFDDPSSGANNTASGPNVSHVFDNSGQYDVTLIGTDSNGCQDTVVQSKTVAPSPQVDFTFDEICEGNNVNFQNTTTIDSPGSVAGYNWSFGDGTNSGQENPQKPYNTYGDYSINLIVTSDNGCSGQRTKNLKVHAIPFVDRNFVENCAGLPTQFTDASYAPNGSIAEATWSIDNGDELEGLNVTNSFDAPGNYTVTQTITSAFGCSNSATFPLDISDFLSAGFEIDPSVFIAEYPIQLVNTSNGADSVQWYVDAQAYSNNGDTSLTVDTSAIGDSITILQYVENSFGCIDSTQRTYGVVEQRTDLAVEQLFLETSNGYLTVGVQLHNRGTTPIHAAELELKTANGTLKEVWQGDLREDESVIYVFNATPSSTVSAEDLDKNSLCVEARIQLPQLFEDEDLSNNEQCLSREETFIVLQPHPNPVNEFFTVKIIANDALTGSIHIIDAEGKVVRTLAREKAFEEGLNTLEVDATSFSSGTYTIVFVNDEHTKTTRFIKL